MGARGVLENRARDGTREPVLLGALDNIGEGHRKPLAFRQFILKINSRCNLSCHYCYMYEMADQSWRAQPISMAPTVIDAIAQRIGEHARIHDVAELEVILHGGEPLLAGPELIALAVKTIRRAVDVGTQVHVIIQTNGVLLSESYLRLLAGLGVRVGVSLDGYQAAQDRHRVFSNGKGSHEQVTAALRRLTTGQYHHLFNGILCTIDIRNDPIATYEALLEFDPPAVDFLLPHGNWSTPPPFRDPESMRTPYAEWLIAVFDRWYGSTRVETDVRLFSEIIRLLMGFPSRTEAVGLSPARMVVVETDGSIELSDILKSTYEGAGDTGMNVLRDSFDAVARHPGIMVRQLGADGLSSVCRGCEIHAVCGGGLHAHRYSDATAFDNPSVYCLDLYQLIDHIRRRVAHDVAMTRSDR
ncbi:FxsB family cyclophane-forming radical SAM/SPASM peptide maturase [Acrocarpospora macrocephala]|nr:FxsB family cyclophane-forming radical SAM/SPASM peptide maturase [Acrocarpospora macrocephala]